MTHVLLKIQPRDTRAYVTTGCGGNNRLAPLTRRRLLPARRGESIERKSYRISLIVSASDRWCSVFAVDSPAGIYPPRGENLVLLGVPQRLVLVSRGIGVVRSEKQVVLVSHGKIRSLVARGRKFANVIGRYLRRVTALATYMTFI